MPKQQDAVIASIPSHLRQFAVHQHYDEYTPQDQAVWRYVMRRNLAYLKSVAHPAYISGLEKTGISLEYIPDIDDMNERLGKIGWKAVVVDGFVPPAAFMEFQQHKILVISAEIRNIKNILYTPAPDIIHEAAGHAPIIADDIYATYLQRIGEYGAKSVFSKLDYELYEAVRQLSIIKEYPDATPEDIEAAEKELEEKVAANKIPSESAFLARLHWWTVEYGLVGNPEDFQIYGAGILSSVGESEACMDPSVKKIPLSVDTAKVDYDITKMQPQLFVAKSFEHLLEVLEDFADTMCFRKGGVDSVKQVMASENIGTVVFDSGVQISGIISEFVHEKNGRVDFIRTSGETALAYNDIQIDGHGIQYHRDGYSSPVGKLQGVGKAIHEMTDKELSDVGISKNSNVSLVFESGYRVSGNVEAVIRKDGNIVFISFENCSVADPQKAEIFNPEWGTFDMLVGTEIVSAFSGSADKTKFDVYPPKSTKKAIKVTYSNKQKALFALYREVDDFRTNAHACTMDSFQRVCRRLSESYPDVWLIRLELLELAIKMNWPDEESRLRIELTEIAKIDNKTADLIHAGLSYISHRLI